MKKIDIAFTGLLLASGGAAAQAPASWAPPVVMADPGLTGRRIETGRLVGNFFPAAGPSRHPAVLVLGGSEGALGAGSTNMAKALQARGWTAFHLSYFRAPGQSPKLQDVPLETFDRAIAWLVAQPGVDPKRVAVLGGSKGAEAALLVAARHPEIVAVVAGMPSSVVWPRIDWSGQAPLGSSWSVGGRPVPYLPYGRSDPSKRIAGLYQSGLTGVTAHPNARIPIQLSPARVLLICGEADRLWPPCLMADQLSKADPRAHVLRYADAGHAVLGLPLPPGDPRIADLASLGGTPAGNEAARLGSGLVDHSQKMTVAARATAEKKTVGQRS